MSVPDVVAELEWLARCFTDASLERAILRRARDEIVALRNERDGARAQRGELERMWRRARADALEKAAALCERMGEHREGVCAAIAESIRALKDKA